MIKQKISFLVPAHNEEKLIKKALESLIKIKKDWQNIEILVGLDSCTDKTPEIVKELAKKNKFIKVYEFKERKGKQAVLEKLNLHITGELIFIHDADWILVYKNKEKFKEFINFFENEKIGGIANGFTTDFFPKEMGKIKSLGFLASSWGNYFLNSYIKYKQTKRKDNLLLIDKEKMIFPFFLDVYKKSALEKTYSKKELRAGDHLERTLRLLNSGYEIVVPEDRDLPRAEIFYRNLAIKDFLNQRVRGMISKKKIKQAYKKEMKLSVLNFHIPFFIYTLSKLTKMRRLKDFTALLLYWFGVFYGILASKFISDKKTSVKKIWDMRMKR